MVETSPQKHKYWVSMKADWMPLPSRAHHHSALAISRRYFGVVASSAAAASSSPHPHCLSEQRVVGQCGPLATPFGDCERRFRLADIIVSKLPPFVCFRVFYSRTETNLVHTNLTLPPFVCFVFHSRTETNLVQILRSNHVDGNHRNQFFRDLRFVVPKGLGPRSQLWEGS